MTRRTRRRPIKTLGWTPDLASLFDHVPEGWTPPGTVRAHQAQRHTTLVARFTTPAGHISTARVKISRAGPGHVWVDEWSWELKFKVGEQPQ